MRAFILVTFLALLGGCTTQLPPSPKPPTAALPSPVPVASVAQPAAIPDAPVDVWLVPLDGFPHPMVTSLARRLSSELHINVRASTHAGTNQQMYGARASGQMISEQVLRELSPVISRLFDTTPKTTFIVLTSVDLNGADGTTRFVFSTHFTGRKSVVSAARLSDAFFGRAERPTITEERLYKIVKKSIGLQYYELPRSTKMESVMYSPIMSLEDLDAVGTAF